MKVLIISQYYYPEQFQINDIAPELVKRGHDVTVLTGLPNYPEGNIFPGYENKDCDEEFINGVRVIRCNIIPRKRDALHLVLNYLSFAINAKRQVKSLKDKFDVVLCYQLSPVTMLSPAVCYAKKHKVPLICYCLDIWPESALGMLKNKRNIIYAFLKRISKHLYSHCDRILVTSKPFIDYFNMLGIEKRKLHYLPQHADSSYLKIDMTAEDDHTIDFMYAGNMGKGQTLEVIVQAVKMIDKKKKFLVHMVGDGSNRSELQKMVDELSLSDKFVFYGNQKRESMPKFYKKADVLLLTLRGDNFVGNTMPGKLQTYMTIGKPIFAAINGAAAEVIADSECGACVAAGDAQGLSNLMAEFIDNSQKYAECGKRAKEYFSQNFTLEIYTDRLEYQINEAVKEYGI